MTWETPSAGEAAASTWAVDTPVHRLPSSVNLVTQWKSAITSTQGSRPNSAQVQQTGPGVAPHTRKVHFCGLKCGILSLIHISEPTRRTPSSYAAFCLKKKHR